mmetsp:Transcript_16122/g.31151  ORF Transcript_16122/g.31151 Transcript_16122/m.31151 type:complete len:555 (+) Transcript_16122:698-2362(+)|eukprot:CAMPEP_0171489476 /NCGR_PEP_ID=MMETSP0958-20121227/2777_1 /TAXON_ID=87120 /ORGANISM="Aurantiochytrium limacinum, Strain ATCCMYA-1381" /LENGTH=554 /DNA_ID=CAMNT_0012022691 /DNA_START=442 /DNA_END=2106 /DNA_ORIENTATION=-
MASQVVAAAALRWRIKVGIEIHARVLAKSKLFSGSSTSFAHDQINPNDQVALFDAGVPGTLPQVNAACVDQAIRTGLALKGQIHAFSVFERKHYFYGDSPLGFQITQQRQPVVSGGELHVYVKDTSDEDAAAQQAQAQKKSKKKSKKAKKSSSDDTKASVGPELIIPASSERIVRITRIQLEQDTGRMLPTLDGGKQLLDLNRAGTGVMEIVTEPDMESPAEAAEFVRTIQTLLRTVGTCDGNMEDGSLRADVNVSVHAPGINSHRVEVKNLNSIRAVSRAVEYEASRLAEIYKDVEPDDIPTPARTAETRAFDALEGISRQLRDKEGAADYRFFPDPDLPPLVVEQSRIDEIERTMPPLPEAILSRLRGPGLELPEDDALVLFHTIGAIPYFDAVCEALQSLPKPPVGGPSQASSWICSVLMGYDTLALHETLHPQFLAHIVQMTAEEEISRLTAKKLISDNIGNLEARDPRSIVEANGLYQINDEGALRELSMKVIDQIAATPKGKKLVKDFLGGKDALLGSFMGQVMRASDQRANARLLEPLVRDSLERFR